MRKRRKKEKQRGGGNGKREGRGCGGTGGGGGGAEGGDWKGGRGTLVPSHSFHTSSANAAALVILFDVNNFIFV